MHLTVHLLLIVSMLSGLVSPLFGKSPVANRPAEDDSTFQQPIPTDTILAEEVIADEADAADIDALVAPASVEFR